MRIILQGIFYLPRHILVVVAIYNDWSSGGAVAVEQNNIIFLLLAIQKGGVIIVHLPSCAKLISKYYLF